MRGWTKKALSLMLAVIMMLSVIVTVSGEKAHGDEKTPTEDSETVKMNVSVGDDGTSEEDDLRIDRSDKSQYV